MFPDDAPYAAPIATPFATPTPILFPFLDRQLFGLLFVISSTSFILVASNLGVALLCVPVSIWLFVRHRQILAISSRVRSNCGPFGRITVRVAGRRDYANHLQQVATAAPCATDCYAAVRHRQLSVTSDTLIALQRRAFDYCLQKSSIAVAVVLPSMRYPSEL